MLDLARKFESYGVEAVVYTDIGRDGMLSGVNIEATVRLARELRVPVFASGGVAGLPLGTVTGMRGEPGQADRVAVVAPAARMGALDVVGVVVTSPRGQARTPVSPEAPNASAPASAGR